MGRAKAAAGSSRARMSNTEAPTNDDPNKRPITGTWDGMDTKMLVDLKHIDVKEFIATCRLTYTDPENPKPSQGKLTFILNKKHYSKTLFEICDIYKTISVAQSEDIHIRSPVVRYVAKVLGSVLHFKPVIAAVTETELPLLFYGVKHLLPAYSDLPAPDTNVAAVLCDTLVKMKNTVLHQPGRASSLYLIRTNFTKPDSQLYQFLGRDGVTYYCRIPNQHITSFLSATNLAFEPDAQYLVRNPSGAVTRRRQTAAAQPTADHVVGNDDDHEDYADQAPSAHDQPYLLLPEDPAPYLVSSPPAGDDISQQMAWMIESTRKNNSMMHMMYRAILKIRPCVCTRGGGVDDGDREHRSKATEDRHAERLVPAAGASTSQTPPEQSLGHRLGRSRRQPGEQSSSESPTHHR
ncbi:hypothetical protein AtNW77_Chr3g0193121 [Arabidopsis thaliana]|uniref:Arabidopsis retrotransposon Orf1 C-terminal domain-containing protein n=2 Tax=Arabidopsis TaxID=3701 RepID=A0A178V610_ARATH|nr:hypothetical protein AXX17_AT3G34850 [Arabidopsis thaliana]